MNAIDSVSQSPIAVPMLDEAVELAELVKPSWPSLSAEARLAGPVCEGEDEGETGTTATEEPAGAEAPDTPEVEEESFTDFDLGELPEEARIAAEDAKKQMQRDYTRKTQALAQEREEAAEARQIVQALQNPVMAPAVLAQLGFDYEDPGEIEEPEDSYLDPDERVEQLEGRVANWEQQQEMELLAEAEEDFLAEAIEAIESTEGRQFAPEELKIINTHARNNRDAQGVPDVEGGVDLLKAVAKLRQSEFVEGRKSPRRPARGTAASKALDLNNRDQRRQAMAEKAEELMAEGAE